MNLPSIAIAAVQALKEHGYAIALYSPEYLQGVDPLYVEKTLSQVGWDLINQSHLRGYRVTYFEEHGSGLLFECQATDLNHAIEQFEVACPKGRITGIEAG